MSGSQTCTIENSQHLVVHQQRLDGCLCGLACHRQVGRHSFGVLLNIKQKQRVAKEGGHLCPVVASSGLVWFHL